MRVARAVRTRRLLRGRGDGARLVQGLGPAGRPAESFRWQLALARRLDKPVVIHSRDAHEDTLRLVEEAKMRGSCTASPTGQQRWSATHRGPLDLLQRERDLPDGRRDPRRGLGLPGRPHPRGDGLPPPPLPTVASAPDSARIASTLREVAEARGEDPASLAARTGENARRLFGLAAASRRPDVQAHTPRGSAGRCMKPRAAGPLARDQLPTGVQTPDWALRPAMARPSSAPMSDATLKAASFVGTVWVPL